MYRLTDDMAQRRVLYRGPVAGTADVLLIDIPEKWRGSNLALGRYYAVLVETGEEFIELERFLTAPRRAPVPPDLLDHRPSAIRSSNIVVTRYDPPDPDWPWIMICRWPEDLARAGPELGVDMARGCYTIEAFEDEAALEEHRLALTASLCANNDLNICLVSADRLPGEGRA